MGHPKHQEQTQVGHVRFLNRISGETRSMVNHEKNSEV
jgi:hypothetical protein